MQKVVNVKLANKIGGGVLLFLLLVLYPMSTRAQELELSIQVSGNQNVSAMTDGSYNTSASFNEGDTITVSAADGSLIEGIYIKWDAPVEPYLLAADGGELEGGRYGYLHEYLPIENGSQSLTIKIPKNGMKICGLRIFRGDDLPEDVQVWQPPCDRADIMLISSHADDEILFMGGITPTYGKEAGVNVQVVYMTEYWTGAKIREHEKLDGLWTDGLCHYPVCGNFMDVYADNLEEAEQKYDLDAMTAYLTDTLRRFRPQVVVTHDFGGEYGHGFHQLTAKAVALALDAAADDGCRTDAESYRLYGSWDVPKAYFHLYPDNKITLNLRVPLESMGGKTALEVAEAAYKQHVSQQWCWFYVSDSYKYSCADFGLYRTRVGADTSNNMMENIQSYAEQERLEQERLEKEEQDRREREERERQQRLEKEEQERQERLERERQERERAEREEQEKMQEGQLQLQSQKRDVIILSGIILGAALVTFLLLLRLRHR